ncbi:hypothetical protein D3C72_2526530 [compost metagenome]
MRPMCQCDAVGPLPLVARLGVTALEGPINTDVVGNDQQFQSGPNHGVEYWHPVGEHGGDH